MITTSKLNHRTCRWPIGDPGRADFHYCGALPRSGQVYCGTHYDISYQTTPRRNAARPMAQRNTTQPVAAVVLPITATSK